MFGFANDLLTQGHDITVFFLANEIVFAVNLTGSSNEVITLNSYSVSKVNFNRLIFCN